MPLSSRSSNGSELPLTCGSRRCLASARYLAIQSSVFLRPGLAHGLPALRQAKLLASVVLKPGASICTCSCVRLCHSYVPKKPCTQLSAESTIRRCDPARTMMPLPPVSAISRWTSAPYSIAACTPESYSCCRPTGTRSSAPSRYSYLFRKASGPSNVGRGSCARNALTSSGGAPVVG